MPNKIDAQILNNVSALAQLGNTIEEAAVVLCMTADEFGALLSENEDARTRWAKGGIEAVNQLKMALTRQALAGSVQAAHLLLKMRGEMAEKTAPIAFAPTTTPAKSAAVKAVDWAPISEVAREIGVTERVIRKRIKGSVGPALETREVKGKRCVSARGAYEHFCQHGERRPDGLRKPRDYETEAIDPKTFDPTIDPAIRTALGNLDPLTMEPSELARRMVLASVDPVKARLAIMWADSNQRRETAELKAAAMMELGEVRKLVRAHAELIKEETDAFSNAFAANALQFERSEFGFDAAAKKPEALALWGCFFLEQMNGIFGRLEERIRVQLLKIRELEFKSAEVTP